MNELYRSSTLVKPTDVETYVSTLEKNKTVILQTAHNYVFATKLFSIQEIYKILDMKHVEDKTAIREIPICLCNGFYDSCTLLELNPIEKHLYHMLTHTFWPGSLNIAVRSKSFVDDVVKYKHNYIILTSPNQPYIRKILETVNMPLVTFLTNKINQLPIITNAQLEENFLSDNIPTMNTVHKHAYLDGLPTTTILIDNNTVTLLRRGTLSFDAIRDHITSNYTQTVQFQTDISISSNITCSKPIYSLQLMDLESQPITKNIVTELQTHTKQMIQHVILIDFNQIHVRYKQYFYGYVDLSESGSIQEYIDSLYSALHTIMKTDCKKIYITDIHLIARHQYRYIQDILEELTQHQKMVIPLLFLE